MNQFPSHHPEAIHRDASHRSVHRSYPQMVYRARCLAHSRWGPPQFHGACALGQSILDSGCHSDWSGLDQCCVHRILPGGQCLAPPGLSADARLKGSDALESVLLADRQMVFGTPDLRDSRGQHNGRIHLVSRLLPLVGSFHRVRGRRNGVVRCDGILRSRKHPTLAWCRTSTEPQAHALGEVRKLREISCVPKAQRESCTSWTSPSTSPGAQFAPVLADPDRRPPQVTCLHHFGTPCQAHLDLTQLQFFALYNFCPVIAAACTGQSIGRDLGQSTTNMTRDANGYCVNRKARVLRAGAPTYQCESTSQKRRIHTG